MAQISIFSTNGLDFINACQSVPVDEPECIGYSDDGSCKFAAASEIASELFNSDPLAFMPNVVEDLESIVYGFVQNSLGMCLPPETIHVAYRWESDDAKNVAKKLLSSRQNETKAFAKYLSLKNNLPFGALTLSALASTTKGSVIAASIIKELRNPRIGVAILFGMKNPARAARILNFWKYRAITQRDAITLELNRIKPNNKNEEMSNRYFRLQSYEYGSSINADLFHDPLTAVYTSEKLLIGFDRYEENLNISRDDTWKTLASLSKARSKLKEHTLLLAAHKLIKPCKLSYDLRNRVEEMECPLIPPPPPQKKQIIPTAPEKKDSAGDLGKMKSLIDDYEYCEAMIDEVANTIANAQYQTPDSGKVHDTVDLIINLEDIIDDIVDAENGLIGKGYDLPYSNDPEELRALLEDIEHEFIELENDVIDMETEQRSKNGE